jgi:hypothetical protein
MPSMNFYRLLPAGLMKQGSQPHEGKPMVILQHSYRTPSISHLLRDNVSYSICARPPGQHESSETRVERPSPESVILARTVPLKERESRRLREQLSQVIFNCRVQLSQEIWLGWSGVFLRFLPCDVHRSSRR